MSSSPDLRGASVLRGAATAGVRRARIDERLSSPLPRRPADPAHTAQLDTARAAAEAAGYAAGWAAGQRAAAAAAEADREAILAEVTELETARTDAVHRAVTAVQQAAESLDRRNALPAAELEDLVAAAAFAVAEAVVGHELRISTTLGADAVRRALAQAPQGRPVSVRLNPQDYATLDGTAPQLGRQVTLVADASLAPGDAIAECDATRIDARLAAAIERVREVLAP